MFRAILLIFGSLFPFFLFCHFGGKVTQRFEDIGYAIYQLEWYRCPSDMQKKFPIVISLAQKRIFMRGYGDTCTTHSIFKKVSIFTVNLIQYCISKKKYS